jgi:hypothetical protein
VKGISRPALHRHLSENGNSGAVENTPDLKVASAV